MQHGSGAWPSLVRRAFRSEVDGANANNRARRLHHSVGITQLRFERSVFGEPCSVLRDAVLVSGTRDPDGESRPTHRTYWTLDMLENTQSGQHRPDCLLAFVRPIFGSACLAHNIRRNVAKAFERQDGVVNIHWEVKRRMEIKVL